MPTKIRTLHHKRKKAKNLFSFDFPFCQFLFEISMNFLVQEKDFS